MGAVRRLVRCYDIRAAVAVVISNTRTRAAQRPKEV